MHIRELTQNIACAIAALAVLVAGQAAVATDERTLARDAGCLICHRGVDQRIGPPFRDVAARYADRADAETVLARSIIVGTGPDGAGWHKEGKARLPFMPPNANVTPEDASVLARWILGVRGEVVDEALLRSAGLEVFGQVAHPLSLDVAALRDFPVRSIEPASADHGAQESHRAGSFTGVLLRDVLDKASITFDGHFDLRKTIVVATATDGYRVVFSWNELFASPVGDGVLIFFEKNGQPLGDDEGRIALLSTQDTNAAPRHVKWLKTIDVRRLTD